MFRTIVRAASVAAFAGMLSVATTGCSSHDDANATTATTAPKSDAQKGKAMVKEAETMKGHGQQLKAQGDETGGQQLIEQSKIKAAQGEQILEKGPATQPGK
ncbi:MAG: hypothetical protein JWO31_341 [Phycisphaerales bacterium]|nr:hypothetical protein [Phycisphaerales bacterium]